MRKYTSQAILNFENTSDLSHHLMQSRLNKAYGTKVPMIQVIQEDSNNLKRSLSMLNSESRLYIIAHGSSRDGNRIYSDTQEHKDLKMWSYISLANILASNLPKQEFSEKQGIFSDRLKITLVVCYGGKPHAESALNSFAAKLQQELAAKNIYVDINAYVTQVVVTPISATKATTEFGYEARMHEIDIEKAQLRANRREKNQIDEYISLMKEEAEHTIHKQPGSKLAFRWGTDEDGNPVQVAYDAYELKEHENRYRELQGLVQELRDYAESRKNEAGYRNAVATATQLATDIEREANSYFNGLNKDEAATKKFHDNSSHYIANAKKILGEKGTTQKLLLHIFEKIEKIIISILPIPSFMRQHLIKKRFLSHSLFAYKTPEQRIADRASSIVDRVRPISPVR